MGLFFVKSSFSNKPPALPSLEYIFIFSDKVIRIIQEYNFVSSFFITFSKQTAHVCILRTVLSSYHKKQIAM